LELKQLNEETALNASLIKRLSKQKELTGRNDESVLIQTLKISKGILVARNELQIQVESPIDREKIATGELSPGKVEEYRELFNRGWQTSVNRELSKEEKI